MDASGNISDRGLGYLIDDFIDNQVTGRGLDERTEKAYRLDLELFYKWMKREHLLEDVTAWERRTEQYINYLLKEKRLRTSTISRKCRVFRYFLAYVARSGSAIGESVPDNTVFSESDGRKPVKQEQGTGPLSKAEVDAFFQAIRKEYEELHSEFRRRLCLRDQIMMELLFYHGIEISELLKMEVSDYNRNDGNLLIRRKKGKTRLIYVFSKELRGQMECWLAEHEYFERDDGYKERMFLSKLGRPLSMKMVILIFEKYRVLAGIEKEFTPKDLKCSMKKYTKELLIERCS